MEENKLIKGVSGVDGGVGNRVDWNFKSDSQGRYYCEGNKEIICGNSGKSIFSKEYNKYSSYQNGLGLVYFGSSREVSG